MQPHRIRSDSVQERIARPTANLQRVASSLAAKPDLLSEVCAGLAAEKARVRYGCLKVLRLISEQSPAVLYPHFDRLEALLDNENKILRWGGIVILSHLAAVDKEGRIDALLERYLQPISGPVMITAANTIGGAARIAVAKPHLAGKIVAALLRVTEAEYQTAECRNVALGHVLKAFDVIFDQIAERQGMINFARAQLRNRRSAVRSLAGKFLRKHGAVNASKPRRA